MSNSKKNTITVLIAMEDLINTKRRGFKQIELQNHCYGVSDSTVSRVIDALEEEGLIRRENGYYYPLVSLQSTWFDTV